MDCWQAYSSRKVFTRVVLILTLLTAVDAGLSSLRFRLWPQLGLFPTMTFAFDSPNATASSHMMYAGLLDRIWPWAKPKSPSPRDPDEVRREQLRRLQILHDNAPTLTKKIDYDHQMIGLLDPHADFEKIRALRAEIQQHEEDIQRLAEDQQRTEAINRVNKALEEQRYADAEREAETALRLFDDPQMRELLRKARTRRLVEEAKDFLAAKEVDKAREKNQEALQVTATDQEAQTIQKNIDQILSKRKTLVLLKIALAIIL